MISETPGGAATRTRQESPGPGRKRTKAKVRGGTAHPSAAEVATAVVTARHAAQHADVAREAYYRAERRGFAPGFELDDWLAAEAALNGGAPHASIDAPVGTDAAQYQPDHEVRPDR